MLKESADGDGDNIKFFFVLPIYIRQGCELKVAGRHILITSKNEPCSVIGHGLFSLYGIYLRC